MTTGEKRRATVLLVNTHDNPDACLDGSGLTVEQGWDLVMAPPEWRPSGPLPGGIRPDLVIVFARKYAEAEALAICEAIRGCREMDGIPLLAAISMYQMPLGNDVKRLPGADIVFTPLKAAEVSGSIGRME